MTEHLTKCYDTHTATGTLPTADELRQLAILEKAEPEQGATSEPEAAELAVWRNRVLALITKNLTRVSAGRAAHSRFAYPRSLA